MTARARKPRAVTVDPVDPKDLCGLCTFPAHQSVQMRPAGWAWANERKPYPVALQVCNGCATWLTNQGWVVKAVALKTKALR